jgi:NAD(P) transhydrogenase subunit alpha
MPADASKMLGKNYINFLDLIIDTEGKLNINFDDEIVDSTCITYNREIRNERVKEVISFEES